MRDWLQGRIDANDHKLARLRERITRAMSEYANSWPEETREVDASVEAAGEYRQMLADLESDGLPRFEARFKALLNENTIREVAGFQSQLRREARRSASASTSSTDHCARSTTSADATSCWRRRPPPIPRCATSSTTCAPAPRAR